MRAWSRAAASVHFPMATSRTDGLGCSNTRFASASRACSREQRPRRDRTQRAHQPRPRPRRADRPGESAEGRATSRPRAVAMPRGRWPAAGRPSRSMRGCSTLDLVPSEPVDQGAWDASAGVPARDLGWTPACGASGSRPACRLVPAIQFVGYEGYSGSYSKPLVFALSATQLGRPDETRRSRAALVTPRPGRRARRR